MAKGGSKPLPQTCQLNVGIVFGVGAQVSIITDNDGTFIGQEDPLYPGRFAITITKGFGTGSSINISKTGYITINHRLQGNDGRPLPIPRSGSTELLSEILQSAIVPEVWPFKPDNYLGPFTPFDSNDDPDNIVHTELPPELKVPIAPDKDFFIGDFGGITTPLAPPLVPGANTTPPNMWMSFFLPKYFGMQMPDGSDCQNYYLTETKKRGASHVVVTSDIDGIPVDVALLKLIQSYKFFTCWWTITTDRLADLASQGLIDIVILGAELNRHFAPGPELDNFINAVCAICNPLNIPVWLHFTPNYPTWQPDGISPVDWCKSFGSKVRGVCWQGDQNDSAGVMGAHLWDARKIHSAAGWLTCAYELLDTNELYGKATETDGRRRSWEMICCTRDNLDWVFPVAGSMGGVLSYPDGKKFGL